MEATAEVSNPDAVGVRFSIVMTMWELRKVMEALETIQHVDNTPFWLFKGHLQRTQQRIHEVVVSHRHEEQK